MLKKSQPDVITNQHWQSNVAHFFTMAVNAELSFQDSFVDASTALKAVPAFLLKKKRAISPPEVILPSFKRAISLPEVVLPKKKGP